MCIVLSESLTKWLVVGVMNEKWYSAISALHFISWGAPAKN